MSKQESFNDFKSFLSNQTIESLSAQTRIKYNETNIQQLLKETDFYKARAIFRAYATEIEHPGSVDLAKIAIVSMIRLSNNNVSFKISFDIISLNKRSDKYNRFEYL